ncbi:hypothetical protein [Flavobacterium okayamense]|uniref:Outer membrane protein beta-barrel domain-containing protein n=1 Tax=Flavobacterium okayamense TaxID=2830782 RepID=A0ABN6HX33_9FLAO|nr:hypothetical protein [Flavobacterium okayamense]BCY27386.1 hypothetical protein KK2020170_02540 [Flavobacterium okayamense]
MQKIILYTVVVLVSFINKLNAQENTWGQRGKESSYEFSVSTNDNQEFMIASKIKRPEGFGSIKKIIDASPYKGKTIKLSAFVKSENVDGWAGLWMRVDFSNKVLAFDNMQNRSIKGTNDWQLYDIVLYISEDAEYINYGFLLDGEGKVFAKDFTISFVPETTPETGQTKGRERTPLSFEEKANAIATNIENITKQEKDQLKKEVEEIEKQLNEGKISKDDADNLKMEAATKRAQNIQDKVSIQEEKLSQLVKDKVDGKVEFEKNNKGGTRIVFGGNSDNLGENQTEINLSSMKVYNGKEDYIKKVSKRTTSQFVFAFGLNNLLTEGESLNDSDYRVWGSHFYEWGLTYNTRIFKNHNLLHAKYGLSLMYNNLRPTDNRYFVKNGDVTELQTGFTNFDESRFRNVYLTAPVHLEFDFTPKKTDKDGNSYFRTHKSLRLGVGGYAGVKIKSKQILKYEEDDQKIKVKQKGDFNVNDFNYGLSAYIGYGQMSLYAKYDLNPLFKNNAVDQNNISLGLRFDFN